MIRELPLTGLVVLLLCSCATGAPSVWTKAGADEAQLARDRYACTQEARVRDVPPSESDRVYFYGSNKMAAQEANRLFQLCMEARGWRKG